MEAARFLLALALLSGSLRSGQGLEEGLISQELLAKEPNAYPGRLFDRMQENEDYAVQSQPEERLLDILHRSFLPAAQRLGHSSASLFQLQGSDRDARASSISAGRINTRAWDTRAPQFLSMATPQRFGRKK